ncbi:MAG: hypothetical protein AAF740_07650 [Bacteroidota bacterium]
MDFYDLPVLLLASTPAVGILGWTLVRMTQSIFGKPMNLSRKQSKQLVQDLSHFKDENTYLNERLENLEVIISGIDPELLESSMRLQSPEVRDSYQKVARAMRNQQSRSGQSQKETQEDSLSKNVKNLLNKIVKNIDKAIEESQVNNARGTNNKFRF